MLFPGAPRAGREHTVFTWTHRCVLGPRPSCSLAFVRSPCRKNAPSSRVGPQQAVATPAWLSVFIPPHFILPASVPKQLLIQP